MDSYPQKGFYKHYKHDPAGALNNYTYEVMGIGKNTEDNSELVLYRPLYDSAWLKPADYCARPVAMFTDTLEKEGKTIERFKLVTDPDEVARLEEVRKMIEKSK
jgi:hypothetical protein